MTKIVLEHPPVDPYPTEVAIAEDLREAGLEVELRAMDLGGGGPDSPPVVASVPWLAIIVEVAERLPEVLSILVAVLERRSEERNEKYSHVPILDSQKRPIAWVEVPEPGKVKVTTAESRARGRWWRRVLKRRNRF